jgi:RimJ/RimL family protein N-acetyltransferase
MEARVPRLAAFDRVVTLRDGTRVRMRPIRPDDEPRLVTLYAQLSRDTRYHRFFSVMRRLPPDWARFLANVDYTSRLALVVEAPGDAETLIAVARYEPAGEPGTVEVAFVVQDDWQGRGLGTVLFGELLAAAAVNGIERFRAWVLADNRRMLDLIARLGGVTQRTIEQGVLELSFRARPARSSGSSG